MAVSNITLTKAMLDYARRHKLEIPTVSIRVNTWGTGKQRLAWRVSGHLHEHGFPVPQSKWRTPQLTHHFFPATMSEKIAAKARQAVAERWSEHAIQSWYGMGDVPWCAETWSYIKSKAGSTTPKMSYVPAIVEAAAHKRDGLSLTSSPRPGDGVCYDWQYDHEADHIETLLSKSGPAITTAAGNSGFPYVVKKYRTTSNVIAWIRVTR
jgi:hypothetical protein